jgi:hypothetical protein
VKYPIRKILDRYRITKGATFRLENADPDDTGGLQTGTRGEAKALLQRGIMTLAELQDKLYAQDRWAVLRRLLRKRG